MAGKCQTVIVIMDFIRDEMTVLDDELPSRACHGNVLWKDEDTLIGISTAIGPYRLGITGMTDHASMVFQVQLTGGSSYKVLSKDSSNIACRSPRLSPDGATLIWLERDVNLGKAKPGPHACCQRLMALDLGHPGTSGKPKIVIDIVSSFNPEVDTFAGLFMAELPPRCITDSNMAVFTCIVNDTYFPIVAKIDELDAFMVMTDKPNHMITDVVGTNIVAVHSSHLKTPSIVLFNMDKMEDVMSIIDSDNLNIENTVMKTLMHVPTEQHELPEFRDVKFSSLFVGRYVYVSGQCLAVGNTATEPKSCKSVSIQPVPGFQFG